MQPALPKRAGARCLPIGLAVPFQQAASRLGAHPEVGAVRFPADAEATAGGRSPSSLGRSPRKRGTWGVFAQSVNIPLPLRWLMRRSRSSKAGVPGRTVPFPSASRSAPETGARPMSRGVLPVSVWKRRCSRFRRRWFVPWPKPWDLPSPFAPGPLAEAIGSGRVDRGTLFAETSGEPRSLLPFPSAGASGGRDARFRFYPTRAPPGVRPS